MGEWVQTRTNVFECDKKALWHSKVWVNILGEKYNNNTGPIRIITSIYLIFTVTWWKHGYKWSDGKSYKFHLKQYTVFGQGKWNHRLVFSLSFSVSLSQAHTHAQTHWDREREKETPTVWYLWRMRRNFKNPWAINQSQSSRTVWQSAHIIGRQAHIRYAFSKARSKLESQLTLLIALSYLIWKTMGIEEEAFTISSSCHHSESLRLPPCFHFN